MPKAARKHYDMMHDHACVKFSEEDFILTDGDAAAGKCRQICNGFIYDENKVARPLHDAKVKALKDLLDDIGNHPTIIFYEFNHDRTVLQKALGKNTPHMGKGTSLKAGVQIEADWNAGKILRLLYNPFSAAHGLNFQGGGYHLIWYNPPWDLEVYDQAIYRVDRIGQISDRILNYILVVRNSIEESVSKVLARKQRTEADIKAVLVKEFNH
jgi:SNF2 family DNA or RNA helicase